MGDINAPAAESLIKDLGNKPSSGDVSFTRCDVTNYSDVYNLFRTAHSKHGHIDHAISCAGIFETGAWFDPNLTIDTVGEQQAPTAVIDVNLMGSANFSRIAVVFLRDGMTDAEKTSKEKSLLLLSSVNAFRESPGLYMYQTSKHAIQGLMRSMRKIMYERDHVRVNCVCPGVTQSPMTDGIWQKFRDADLYWQSAESVAMIILGIVCKEGMSGKAVYIEGGEGWEFEDSFYREQPRWLGEEPTRRMRVNTEAVQKVSRLTRCASGSEADDIAGCVGQVDASLCPSHTQTWPTTFQLPHSGCQPNAICANIVLVVLLCSFLYLRPPRRSRE